MDHDAIALLAYFRQLDDKCDDEEEEDRSEMLPVASVIATGTK
jgi:hypothetical protein